MKTIQKFLIGLTLLSSGCAATVASIDADAALQVAAQANTVNLKVMAAARMREHDKSIEQIETIFENQLAGVSNGADAVKALMAYRQIRAKAEAAKADAAGKLQGALNTGYELESLIERRVALRAAWKTFFGQFPALAQIRTLAEAEVRTYMDTLNRGFTNE